MSNKIEQLINLKFLVKLGKNEHVAYHSLKKAYGDRCISHACAHVYFDRYCKSLEEDSKEMEEIKNMNVDTNVENIAPSSNASSSTHRIRSKSISVVDSIGFRKYCAILTDGKIRNRSKSISTSSTDYYTPEQHEYTDDLYAAGPSQSNEMKKSDTIDAQASNISHKKVSDDNNLVICSSKESSKPSAYISVLKDADCYNMNHKNRGKCIIFNHEKFNTSYENREGSTLDAKRLEITFGNLGFDVEIHNDFTHYEIMDKIDKVSQLDHTDNDCLCIIVLTHGMQNDLICAKDVVYKSDMLWKPFTADKCTTLAGKPKLFFLQACRGEESDSGIILSARSLIQTETDTVASYAIPTHADFLIAHSSIQGFFTWRNPSEGTWYIQCLCDILDQHGTTMDLMNILTLTARKVATEYTSISPYNITLHNKKQVPSVTTMLIRSVYFPPKPKE